MRVRSPNGARLSVEQEAHCALFARALGVEIDEDDLLAYLLQLSVFVSSVKCPIRFITHTSPKLVL